MLVTDLLTPESIHLDIKAGSKKRAIEIISELLAADAGSKVQAELFENIYAREKLGSTGLGNGVAIPHGRNSSSTGVNAVFIRFVKPIDFEALDEQPVDLIFALAVPKLCNDNHLQLLAQIAETLNSSSMREQLRNAQSPSQIHRLLSAAQYKAA